MSTLTFGPEGALHASGTRHAFGALSDDLVNEGYPPMRSNYGDRELADEIRIFTARYRQQAAGVGPFGDVRTWDGASHGYPGGTRWVRFSPDGTVAAPGTSNHGKRRSSDLAYPYDRDTPAHRRAQQLAKRHNITCDGIGFREWWHWTFWGVLGSIASTNPEPPHAATQEDDMRAVRQTGIPNSGIIIQAGVPPYSLPDQVFDALCGSYGLTAVELPDWKYGTVVREQWTAASAAAALSTGQAAKVDPAAIAEIVAGVRAALPKTFTVTATPS